MPRIAECSGIVLRMFHTEHHPPHFHATYGEHEALVGIDPIDVVSEDTTYGPVHIEKPAEIASGRHEEP